MFKNFYLKLFCMTCICALSVLFVNISYLEMEITIRMPIYLTIFFFLSISIDGFIYQFSKKYFKKKIPLTKNFRTKLNFLFISFILTLAGFQIAGAFTIYLFYKEFLKDGSLS